MMDVDKVLASVRFWLALNKKERAVIEAARLCVTYSYPYRRKDCDLLDKAVEALEQEET